MSSTTDVVTHKCVECQVDKDKGCFYKKQWKLGQNGMCKRCADKFRTEKLEQQKLQAEHKCTECSTSKAKSEFYRKQWHVKGMCKPCWDNRGCKRKQEDTSHSDNAKKQKVEVECTCITCKVTFFAVQRKTYVPKECGSCEEQKRQKRHEAKQRQLELDKKAYWMTYGVGYDDSNLWDCNFSTKPIDAKSLVGNKYRLVYYCSDECSNQSEDIHRTARGTLEFSMQMWHHKPALHGTYKIDTRTTNGDFTRKDYWGEEPSASFIEQDIADWSPSNMFLNFNMFHQDQDSNDNDDDANFCSNKGRKLFVMVRGDYESYKYDWWNNFEHGSDYKLDLSDTFCGAKLKVLDERVALGLAHDSLYENSYRPSAPNLVVDSLEHADKLMAKYRDSSNSWMCKHLGITQELASLIREYVTPAPVFYLEEGDLVLQVEETSQIEWEKTLVFRKET